MQRQARGWSVPEMRRHLREAAREAGDTLPGNECLGVMIRRWEKDDGGVSERYRMHFCRAFGVPFEEFGTAPPPAAAIRQVLAQDTTAAEVIRDPEDEDVRAELARLRSEHAELAARYSRFRRGLLAWVHKAMHENEDWKVI